MYKVRTYNTIAKQGLDKLPQESFSVDPGEKNPDAIILRSQVLNNTDIPDSVKVVGRAGAGTNNLPVADLTKRGIPVFNTPGANANAVCEVVMAGLFLASRNICRAWDYVKHLEGGDIEAQVEKDKKQFSGFEIAGKTLGVIGLGSVGAKVANTAIALGMKVIGYDPAITISRAWELSSQVEKANTIESLIRHSDFVTIHVPLNEHTKNLIGKEQIANAKKGIVLLNFSRSGIINDADLLQALDDHHVYAYVTDFPSEKLISHSGVICLPHLGASTQEAELNCAVMIAEQIKEFIETGAIKYSVNFPSVDVPAEINSIRLAIANANVPNMVAQISEKLAEANRNIVSLVNKSRDDVAYTVIDVDDDIDDAVLKNIQAIKGVLQVRKIMPRA